MYFWNNCYIFAEALALLLASGEKNLENVQMCNA